MTVHVLPVNDLKEHAETDDCECHPSVQYVGEGGKVVTHHSYDHREWWEEWEAEKNAYLH